LIWISGLTMFVADLIALLLVGMWLGLSARNPKRAFSGTIMRVLVLPWIAFGAFLMFIAVSPSYHPERHERGRDSWRVVFCWVSAADLVSDCTPATNC